VGKCDDQPDGSVGLAQLIEATSWGTHPRHLLPDRDAFYSRDFRQRAKGIGIDAITTPVRSPRANAIAECVIGTLGLECLDYMIMSRSQEWTARPVRFRSVGRNDTPLHVTAPTPSLPIFVILLAGDRPPSTHLDGAIPEVHKTGC
jgi:transposase InsO family protein